MAAAYVEANRHSWLTRWLHLQILLLIGVAHPLLDVFARNPAFFVVNGNEPADVVFLVLFFFALPGCLILAMRILEKWNSRIAEWAFRIALFSLLFLMIQLASNLVLLLSPALSISFGAILAAVTVYGYGRYTSVQSFFTFLAPALIVVPAVFVLKGPIRTFLTVNHRAGELKKIASTIPIVFIVFDEFPLSSLLDQTQQIDPTRNPNFAQFAAGAYWFRNASSVSDNTITAVPAIVTGKIPKAGEVPAFYDHRQNLFTLVGGSYRVTAKEPLTKLCPDEICGQSARPNFIARVPVLLQNVSALYLQMLAPDFMKDLLPPISQRWVNLWGNKVEDRAAEFHKFLGSIHPSGDPALYFDHVYLPHRPFVYLPSGEKQEAGNAEMRKVIQQKWPKENSFLSNLNAHLLQVGYVDRLLGELVKRLKETGLYDKSLIVLVADHGICFRPGESSRGLTDTNYQDILPVPLFIKLPGQQTGIISDRNVQTIDVLPTVADVLSLETSGMDGSSMLRLSDPEPKEKFAFLWWGEGSRKTFRSHITMNEQTLDGIMKVRQVWAQTILAGNAN